MQRLVPNCITLNHPYIKNAITPSVLQGEVTIPAHSQLCVPSNRLLLACQLPYLPEVLEQAVLWELTAALPEGCLLAKAPVAD